MRFSALSRVFRVLYTRYVVFSEHIRFQTAILVSYFKIFVTSGIGILAVRSQLRPFPVPKRREQLVFIISYCLPRWLRCIRVVPECDLEITSEGIHAL